MQKIRVAVTGASGRIGRFVVRDLVARGHDVLAVDRRVYPERNVKFVLADLRVREQVFGVLSQVDSVVHLGEWAHASQGPSPEDVWADNTRASGFMIQMASDLKLRSFVYASSAQVYGFNHSSAPSSFQPVPMFLPFDETHPVAPNNAYAMGKVAIEQYAQMVTKIAGLKIAMLRFPHVAMFPPEDEIWKRIAQGNHRRDILGAVVHVTDAARAIAFVLEQPGAGCEIYNVTSDHVMMGVSMQEYFKLHHPDYPPLPANFPADGSVVRSDKLKEHYGWRAEFDLRDLKKKIFA